MSVTMDRHTHTRYDSTGHKDTAVWSAVIGLLCVFVSHKPYTHPLPTWLLSRSPVFKRNSRPGPVPVKVILHLTAF